jgi:hypothetical protein
LGITEEHHHRLAAKIRQSAQLAVMVSQMEIPAAVCAGNIGVLEPGLGWNTAG